MNFTHNNHLKYSIGGRGFGFRENGLEDYKVSVGQVDPDRYLKSTYKQELLRTADLIHEDLGDDFVVLLSGGTDSEIVARNFVENGLKPRCVTIKFKHGYNDYDVQESYRIANELNLEVEAYDFDVEEFLYSGEADEFGKKLQCTQITYLMVYHTVMKLGMPAVMGGEVLMRRNINTNPSSWYYCFRENEDASAMRFSNTYGIPLVNEYFSYTPELLLYWLELPMIEKLVNEKYNYKLASVSSKNAILKSLVPEIKERVKTHGFEKLLAFNFEAYRTLTANQILRLESSLDGIEYNQVIAQLKGQQ
jgi:hypothetical protein